MDIYLIDELIDVNSVSSGTSTRYVDARVFFNPEPDMIHLDGGIWRCGREGREYVIRERIA